MNVKVIYFIAIVILAYCFIVNSSMPKDLNETDEFGDEFYKNGTHVDMSYLKCNRDGCKLIQESAEYLLKPRSWILDLEESRLRVKRRIFLPDNRLRVREKSVRRFPFNSAVVIRVNGIATCSGVAVLKPRFFLTAAHCLQLDGKRKDIEVGSLHHYRKMRWVKADNIRLHPVWRSVKASKKSLRLKDYAVIETEAELPVKPMTIGYVGVDAEGNEMLRVNKTYIYLNAFDNDKHPDDLNMRFCRVKKIKKLRIFSRCDTVPRTAGAGVYVRMRNKENNKVDRKVIAIATGDFGIKANLEYSVALRISSRMFPHICYFVTGSFNGCIN